jgi:hypothetical protein
VPGDTDGVGVMDGDAPGLRVAVGVGEGCRDGVLVLDSVGRAEGLGEGEKDADGEADAFAEVAKKRPLQPTNGSSPESSTGWEQTNTATVSNANCKALVMSGVAS